MKYIEIKFKNGDVSAYDGKKKIVVGKQVTKALVEMKPKNKESVKTFKLYINPKSAYRHTVEHAVIPLLLGKISSDRGAWFKNYTIIDIPVNGEVIL